MKAYTDSAQLILNRAADRCRDLMERLLEIVEGVRETIGDETFHRLTTDLETDINKLKSAVESLEEEARSPEVVIAVAGTTSAGKSTLANLLVGARLLPKAVQEMSAGVVQISHSESSSQLIIEETERASWETGVWDSPTADQIRKRLRSTMKEYREVSGRVEADGPSSSSRQIDSPQFVIHWPTRMGMKQNQFGIPEGADLKIIDLPGLKHTGDDLTRDIIREQTRKALSLIAYNAFETDQRKQEALLQEIVDQAKALGGSPARMLFILNRIDAYLTDPDPEASEKEFTERISAQIRDRVREALPEYTDAAEAIEPIPLSSEPALYAVRADEGGDKETDFLERIEKEYRMLLPDEELLKLPRDPAQWSEAHRNWVKDVTLREARFETFENRLGKHISENLPDILLPDLLDDIYRPGRDTLKEIDAAIAAYKNEENQQLKESREKLEELHSNLRSLKDEALSILDPIREALQKDEGSLLEIMESVPKVERELDLRGDGEDDGELEPLRTAVDEAVKGPLRRLNDYTYQLMRDEEPDDSLVESAPSIGKLNSAVEMMRSSPYGRVWREGGEFEEEESEEVKRCLSKFGGAISSVSTELIEKESRKQAERIETALISCLEAVIDMIEDEAVRKFANIQAEYTGLEGIFRGKLDVDTPDLPSVNFSPHVHEWSRIVEHVETETYTVRERKWYYLWFGKGKTEKTRKRTVEEKHEGIRVGGFGSLVEGFVQSNDLKHLENQFAEWIEGEIKDFSQVLDDRLGRGIRTYRRALQERKKNLEQNTESRVESALRHRDNLEDLQSSIDNVRSWRNLTND